MLVLIKKQNEVFLEDGTQLRVDKFASKGEGHEAVRLDGIPEANGQRYYNLSKLSEGRNEVTGLKGQTRANSSKVKLTPDEIKEIEELEHKIALIKKRAEHRAGVEKYERQKREIAEFEKKQAEMRKELEELGLLS